MNIPFHVKNIVYEKCINLLDKYANTKKRYFKNSARRNEFDFFHEIGPYLIMCINNYELTASNEKK